MLEKKLKAQKDKSHEKIQLTFNILFNMKDEFDNAITFMTIVLTL